MKSTASEPGLTVLAAVLLDVSPLFISFHFQQLDYELEISIRHGNQEQII